MDEGGEPRFLSRNTFGYFKFRPRLLQRLHNSKCLLASLCCCTAVQSLIANSLYAISVPSLERRFDLSSVQSGILSSVYDVGVLLALLPVSFAGNRGHKGVWYGGGISLIAVGALLFATPQFLSGDYDYGSKVPIGGGGGGGRVGLCNSTSPPAAEEQCGTDAHGNAYSSRSPLYFFIIMILAQVLNGLGTSPISTLGVAYLDENVSQKASPLYVGIYQCATVVGVSVGYFVMSTTLNLYGDFLTANMTQVYADLSGPSDPLWYGAYWLNYIIASVAALLAALPMCGFSRALPGSQRHRLKDIDQRNRFSEDSSTTDADFGKKVSELPLVIKNLVLNPTLVGLLIMKCADAFFGNGVTTFAPKIFESAYGMNQRQSAVLIGVVFIVGGLTGGLLSGYLLRRFKVKVRGALVYMIVLHVVAFAGQTAFLIRCADVNIAGVTAPYEGSFADSSVGHKFSLNNSCNAACDCSNRIQPVCHAETNVAYASACYAGCTKIQKAAETKRHAAADCGCLSNATTILTAGYCKKPCPQKYLFVLLIGMTAMAVAMLPPATFLVMLRCVPFNQRTLALGLTFTIVRLVGFIPGPIVYGSILDSACIVWKESCGERLSCRKYSPKVISKKLVFTGCTSVFIAIIGLIIARIFYRDAAESKQQVDTNRTDSSELASRNVHEINGTESTVHTIA